MPVTNEVTPATTATLASASTPGIGAAALLDAMPDATVVLDHTGTIVAVNRVWRMFALDNGAKPGRTGIGVNYLDVCARSAAAGCSDAAAVIAGLQAVFASGTVECDLEYACPSPAVSRWFMMRGTTVAGPDPGVLVSHVNISRRKMAEQDLERRASEDPLTGLANRALLTRRLAAALTPRPTRAPRADVGLLFLDLDGFKAVNDTFGHAAGDEVLQNVASRLSRLARPQDTIARYGGDEFAVVAPRITADGLVELVARVESAFLGPHLIHGQLVDVGASVGAYLAASGESAADSLQRADEAMYVVKSTRPHRA
jgi:diguanylate cyclase (GGDEF)-like protein